MISDLVIRLILVLDTIFLPLMMQSHINTDYALSQAIGYLENECNTAVGLIRESPEWAENDDCVAFPRYWLATDNQLAQYALEAAGADEFASTLADTLQTHPDYTVHDIIKVLNGENIDIPPKGHVQREVALIGDTKICHEERSGPIMNDWKTYADLLLYGSLDAFYHPEEGADTPEELYEQAMKMFIGKGFADRAFCRDPEHRFTTYKLALAVYTAHIIGQPEPQDVLMILLAQQDDSTGGFYTLYDVYGASMGSTSTEPTAHAILALSTRTTQSNSPLIAAAQCKGLNPLPGHLPQTVR